MAVTSADLAEWIGTDDDLALARDLDVAQALVDAALVTATKPVDPTLLDRLYCEVGQAVYDRRKATSSNQGSSMSLEGQVPVRAPRDPLAGVWPILRRLGVRPF